MNMMKLHDNSTSEQKTSGLDKMSGLPREESTLKSSTASNVIIIITYIFTGLVFLSIFTDAASIILCFNEHSHDPIAETKMELSLIHEVGSPLAWPVLALFFDGKRGLVIGMQWRIQRGGGGLGIPPLRKKNHVKTRQGGGGGCKLKKNIYIILLTPPPPPPPGHWATFRPAWFSNFREQKKKKMGPLP